MVSMDGQAARQLGIGAAIGFLATLALVIGRVRVQAGRKVAAANLWPRPDGSTRSFGEVWDFAANTTRQEARRPARPQGEGR
jgi:hypothetical protein